MGPIGCSETLVDNFKSTLRNNPKDLRCHLHKRWKPKNTHNTLVYLKFLILKQLIFPRPAKKFPAFLGTQIYTLVFTIHVQPFSFSNPYRANVV